MSIGFFITARLGSTRLKQKHLIEVNGLTFLEWLIKRIELEFTSELKNGKAKIFITTSENDENKKFEDYSNDHVRVFYGSDDNIPLRHLQCAKANSIENIIAIDGDDILCSPIAARLVLDELLKQSQMAKTSGLPLGMNVMGYKTDFLESSLTQSKEKILETGWGKIFDMQFCKDILIPNHKDYEKLRMTLDYDKDSEFFEMVIKSIADRIVGIKDEDLLHIIISNKWNLINEGLNDEYWINFNRQQKKEN